MFVPAAGRGKSVGSYHGRNELWGKPWGVRAQGSAWAQCVLQGPGMTGGDTLCAAVCASIFALRNGLTGGTDCHEVLENQVRIY